MILLVRCILIGLLAYSVLAVAIIEYFDGAAGGAIEEKMTGVEANLKWRYTARIYTRLEWYPANGLEYGAELTEAQRDALDDAEQNARLRPRDIVLQILSSWGIYMHLTAFLGFVIATFFCYLRRNIQRDRMLGFAVAAVCIACLSWASYRHYFASLGW